MNENATLFFVDRHLNSFVKDKKAFIEYGDSSKFLTYRNLYDETSKLNSIFFKYNINREDRVILLMQDIIEYPIIFWGCLKFGIVPVLLNTLLSTEVINEIINDSRAKAIFISTNLLDNFELIILKNPNIKSIFEVGSKK